MRTLALLALTGIVCGVLLAVLVHEVRRPAHAVGTLPCTSDWLRLTPTVSVDKAGVVAFVGFDAPGPAHCIAGGEDGRRMSVKVTSADGKLIAIRTQKAGPRPASEVVVGFLGVSRIPAMSLCRAKQPLHVEVEVIGLKTGGDFRMHRAGRGCALG